jgi:hypothetical protein
MKRFRTLASLVLLAGGLCTTAAVAENTVYPDAESVQPLQPGASVPSAVVRTVEGKPVDLAELVREQGATLVFYRGGW